MTKYKDVNEFFKIHLPNLVIDRNLLSKLENFRLAWLTKDDEYIEFMGSNLVGVHGIRFSSIDDNNLMSIFNIDDIDNLQKEFYLVKGINKSFKIASNVIYHTLIYIAHRFLTDKRLNKETKEKGIKSVCLILQYRMFSSLYSHYFKYKVKEEIAITVNKYLSNKFIIKQKNSWGEVFEYRTYECIENKSPNFKRLLRYTTEDAVRIVTDIQTKLRSMLISIYKVLVEVITNKDIINAESATFVGGEKEEKQVKDIETNVHKFITNITQIAYNKNDFIIDEYVNVTDGLFSTINKDLILKFLRCMSDENNHKRDKFVKLLGYDKKIKDPYIEMLKDIVVINMEYLNRWKIDISNKGNIPKSIIMIKNYWSSSKVSNEKIKRIKTYLANKAVVCTGKKTKWMVVTLAIAFITYTYIRSLKD